MPEKKQWRVTDVRRANGCTTKFDADRVYKNTTPQGAASKGLTRFCSLKLVHGVCTFYISVQQVGKTKTYTYKCTREPAPDNPHGRFRNKCTRVDKQPSKKKGASCKHSRGSLRKSSKQTKKARKTQRKRSLKKKKRRTRK